MRESVAANPFLFQELAPLPGRRALFFAWFTHLKVDLRRSDQLKSLRVSGKSSLFFDNIQRFHSELGSLSHAFISGLSKNLPFNYPKLGELKREVETLRENEMLGKRFIDLKETELPTKIGLCGTAGGAGSLGIGAAASASSLLVNSELTKRILVLMAKSFGVAVLAGFLIAGYLGNCILKKSEDELDTYKKDAKFEAMQMEQAMQERRIAIQRSALGAHL